MINENLLNKAEKYKLNIDKYKDIIDWFKNTNKIILPRDKEKMMLVFELREYIINGEIDWIRKHISELYIDMCTEDKGYAFVDIVNVRYKNTDELVCELHFFGDGEASDFIKSISRIGYSRILDVDT